MRLVSSPILVCLSLVLAIGCTRQHKSRSGEAKAAKIEVAYDDSVPSKQRRLLENDLKILSDAGITDHSDTSILDIPDFTNQSLHDWFGEGIHFIVGESFSESAMIGPKSRYPAELAADGAVTVMLNLGGGFYKSGKKKGALAQVPIAGQWVSVTSPMVGILKIGAGLFGKVLKAPHAGSDDPVNSYARLAVLGHEKRHSQGRGKNLCFSHEVCTSGTYAGEPACEKYYNGPYRVERVILEKFRGACEICNKKDNAYLDLLIADSYSRSVGYEMGDPTPETTL
ncbi:MAG: hypothetical protein HYR96_02080 [Deltaproteobacteria bacterium]|nr:hypothetical protein [Deltaproteobacteria bacterium]MBI3295659.1 hypothetical protein [Deltaproteobacteria bacterium]